jgi:DNA-binding beta-propeller fold protein YncE
VDRNGVVVRHLAAGMLGATAPAPLKPDSLTQALIWDGNDDAGKPLAAGDCRARVTLGISAVGERIIGEEKQTIGAVNAMAVGPAGELYVFDSGRISVLDRDGKYQRQIMPYPSDIEPAKLAGLDPFRADDGTIQSRRWYPHLKWAASEVGQMAISPKGDMLYLPGVPRYARTLTRIGTDGSVAAGAFATRLTTHADNGHLYLACSPDGKTLYMSGAEAGYMGDDARELSYRQSVYRLRLDSAGPAETFTGDDENSGDDGFSVDTPKGLAVNPAGHVYVCNYGSGNVAVYTPGAGFIRKYAIAKPQLVAVNPRSGQLYVLCGSESSRFQDGYHYAPVMHDAKLVRLSAAGEVEAELVLDPPSSRSRLDQKTKERVSAAEFTVRMAVDFSDPAKPLIWVGLASPSPTSGKWGLVRIEDLGPRFGEPKDVLRPGKLMGSVSRIAYDSRRDILHLGGNSTIFRYSGNGEPLAPIKLTGPDGAAMKMSLAEYGFAADGTLYYSAMGAGFKDNFLGRADPQGKALPFATGPVVKISHMLKGGSSGSSRGFAVNARGEMYVLHFDDDARQGDKAPTELWEKCIPLPAKVAKYGADGKLINARLVAYLRSGAHGLRVDSKDNVYVADNFMPAGVSYPSEIARVMPDDPLKRPYPARLPDATFDRWLQYMGSVIKFGPAGGAITGLPEGSQFPPTPSPSTPDLYRPVPETQWFMYGYHNLRVTGAQWQFHGISPVPSQYQGVTHVERCVCSGARFDIDGFDRVFVPDTLRHRVSVLDANGNLLCRFGRAGNADTPVEQLGFMYPAYVAGGDNCAFVGDDRRIVKVKFAYAAEAVCGLGE